MYIHISIASIIYIYSHTILLLYYLFFICISIDFSQFSFVHMSTFVLYIFLYYASPLNCQLNSYDNLIMFIIIIIKSKQRRNSFIDRFVVHSGRLSKITFVRMVTNNTQIKKIMLVFFLIS